MNTGRRKKLIINRGYQWRFIATFMGICLTGAAAAFVSFMYLADSSLENGMYKSHIMASGVHQIVLPAPTRACVALLAAGGILISGVSLVYARRTQLMVDGFRRGLGMLREGRLDFCFDDESRHDFPELDAAMNNLLDKNRKRIERLRAALDGMDGPIDRLGGKNGPCISEKAAALTEVRAGMEELFGTLDEFKL